jgi:predicted glycosyltransferase involved in capsule biosynthesis
MVVHDYYTALMSHLLDKYNGVHIGKTVLYLSEESTNKIAKTGTVTGGLRVDRSVKYFEGGSLGIRQKTFVTIGGFNESFIGYGNEDTEFYNRLSHVEKFHNNRHIDLIHLYHTRTLGWKGLHEKNKKIERELLRQPMVKRLNDLRERLGERYQLSI